MNFHNLLILIIAYALMGCYNPWKPEMGGAGTMMVAELPFTEDYTSLCTQGTNGATSHRSDSTRHDVDLDTRNDIDEPVFAPVSGTLYVHDQSPNSGFGIHANIDLSDGTYILLGHLNEIFVQDGVEVAKGQLIGYEGNTGNSSGDHIHMGRHEGQAWEDAVLGQSIDTLSIRARNYSTGEVDDYPVEDMYCDLPGGDYFMSLLETAKWHPDGSLIMTPDNPDVYIVHDGEKRPFLDESVFWSYGLSFADVALVTDEEMACYDEGPLIDTLASETNEDLIPSFPGGSDALYMGELVKEFSKSDVYAIGDGMAYPVFNWDSLLKMGFGHREIRVVDDGVIDLSSLQVGSCAADMYCVDDQSINTCGGFNSSYNPPVDEGQGGIDDTGQNTGDDTDSDLPVEDTDMPTDTYSDTDSDMVQDTDAVDTDRAIDTVGVLIDTSAPSPLHSDDFMLSWHLPGVDMQSVTLAGVYLSQSGLEEHWTNTMTSAQPDVIGYVRPGVQSGDQFRFSVEYVTVNGIGQSACQAPFPPGTAVGFFSAEWGQDLLAPIMQTNGQGGCEFFLQIP